MTPVDDGPLTHIPLAPPREKGLTDVDYLRQLALIRPLVRDRYGILFAFSHAHMLRLLTSDETRQVEVDTLVLQGITDGPLFDFLSNSLLYANGERHRLRRTPLARSFHHSLMDALRPEIRTLAEEIVSSLIGQGETDFMASLANPLPARLIARIVGVPEVDVPMFSQLVYAAVLPRISTYTELKSKSNVTIYINLILFFAPTGKNDSKNQIVEIETTRPHLPNDDPCKLYAYPTKYLYFVLLQSNLARCALFFLKGR